KFNEAVNLQQLAFAAFQGQLWDAVYVQDDNFNQFFPSFSSYDSQTNDATFGMLDRLAPGHYQLHLVGTTPLGDGIADLAGNPLANDYVLDFTVTGLGRSTDFLATASTQQQPQDLGVLAPFELQNGITVTGIGSAGDSAFFQFQVLQNRDFILTL